LSEFFLLVENPNPTSRVRTILKKSGAIFDAVDFFRVPDRSGMDADRAPSAVRNEAEKLPTTISDLMLGKIRES